MSLIFAVSYWSLLSSQDAAAGEEDVEGLRLRGDRAQQHGDERTGDANTRTKIPRRLLPRRAC